MERTSSQLQGYFRYIALSQKVDHPPFDWDNAKKISIEIISRSLPLS